MGMYLFSTQCRDSRSSTKYGSGLIIMNQNEGRESYYRMHDSQISPAWMDPENSTAHHVRPNPTEGTTSSPNLDVITSSPDLQWLLQSSLLSQPDTNLGTFSSFTPTTMPNCPCLSQCSSPDPSCNGAVGDSSVGHANKHMSSEELDRIRIRRQRNRIAAARCRDRRRMLIDTLQNETDHLEHVKTQLEEEITALERERERLELIFEAHMPICKLNDLNPE
ncbi:proto-oncogene c-Fos-like [Sinocyclocheilus grahami]|uniref:proto-oncogene c-Fos-like n=1 Tax=Sinocyclocheilus grahami TaxID=75366 RepID=UPI0007AC5CB2|nr:PREDICTED: proto-oncogene c-Fos-like [Sinocyclocheilus grahami]